MGCHGFASKKLCSSHFGVEFRKHGEGRQGVYLCGYRTHTYLKSELTTENDPRVLATKIIQDSLDPLLP